MHSITCPSSAAASGGWSSPIVVVGARRAGARALPAEGVPLDDHARRGGADRLAESGRTRPSPLDNQERMRALSQQLLSLPILARVVREERLGSGAPNDPADRHACGVRLRSPFPIRSRPPTRCAASTPSSCRTRTAIRRGRSASPTGSPRCSSTRTRRLRAEHAEDTSAFIATQLRASQARLADLEARLRKAKESHIGQLPEQTQANLQTLSGLRQQLDANATALRGEQDRLSMIERQLEGLKQGSGDVADPAARQRGGAAARKPRGRAAARAGDGALGVYRQAPRGAAARGRAGHGAQGRPSPIAQRPAADRLAQLQIDPAYRQLVADREMARLRIRELQRADTDGQRQIGMYQARVEAAPMVEQQLATVQRDYDLEKQQYSDLSAKLHASTIAESVERNRSGEQFTVLYPASLPDANRPSRCRGA